MNYDYADETYRIQLEPLGNGRYAARIGERRVEFVARQLNDGGWRIELEGESITAYCAAQAQERFVAVKGDHFILTIAEQGPTRRSRASAGDLAAQMPGQVTDLRIREGDLVEAGQTLLVIEAMKMEIRIAAPQAGRVLRLLVGLGDRVERGQRLLEIGD
jgi:biotin carboxyl carrier protein